MTFKQTLFTACALLITPMTALAYLNPEEVLLNRDLYLPPTARDAQDRSSLQTQEASARREREQEAAFALQHPAAPEEPTPPVEQTNPYGNMQFPGGYIAVPIQMQNGMFMGQPMYGSAPQTGGLDSANLELLRTMRLLSRVNQNQVMEYPQPLHGGAPNPLAPSGAGAILSALTMAGSVLWTLRRAAKSRTAVIA